MAAWQINWRRGLFRVWLVLSLLWVAFAIALTWSSIANPYIGSFAFVQGQGDTAWSYGSEIARAARDARARDEMSEIEIQGAPGVSYFVQSGGTDLEQFLQQQAPLVLEFYEARQQEKRPGAIAAAAGIALIPPLFVLIVGALAAWAISGFASRPNGT